MHLAKINKLIAVACLPLALIACVHTNSPDTTVIPDIVVARPAPINLHKPQIVVVNQQNVDEFIRLVNSGQIMVTMSLEEFEQLVENNQQIAVFIANQTAVIDVYENRITRENNK